jgi:predicted TIM-barrel fold metal-dependent hydrolase
MKIDCQSHVMPEAYIEVFAKNPQSPTMQKESNNTLVILVNGRPVIRNDLAAYDIAKKIKDMDGFGIDMSIISPNIPGPCMLAPELALKGARILNDYVAEAIQLHPDRLAGIACLPWQNTEEALAEMDRAADQLKLCGVMLFSNIDGQPVDEPQFEPIFAQAEAKGLPIVIHPTFPSWGAAIRDYMMIPMMGFQVDSSFALLRLILSGMLERHPRLKIVMPHVGGVLPYMIGRIDYQTEKMGRKPEHIIDAPSEYLKRVYFDTCSPSAPAIKFAIDFIGAQRTLFGSDHPWVDPQMFIDIINGLDISEPDKAVIFSQNAQQLFKLGS